MGQKSGPVKEPAEQVVKEIRRTTRRQFLPYLPAPTGFFSPVRRAPDGLFGVGL